MFANITNLISRAMIRGKRGSGTLFSQFSLHNKNLMYSKLHARFIAQSSALQHTPKDLSKFTSIIVCTILFSLLYFRRSYADLFLANRLL